MLINHQFDPPAAHETKTRPFSVTIHPYLDQTNGSLVFVPDSHLSKTNSILGGQYGVDYSPGQEWTVNGPYISAGWTWRMHGSRERIDQQIEIQ